LSKERIINAFKGLGFSNIDTQVYVFLAKEGPHKMREITLALNLQENKVHRSLTDLQNIRIVKASIKHPLEFAAIPFNEIIDLFIKIKKEQAKTIRQSKEELMKSWKKIIKKSTKNN